MDLQRFFDPFSPIPDTVLPEVIVDSKPKEQGAKNEVDLTNIGNILTTGGNIYEELGNSIANKKGWIDAKVNYRSTDLLIKKANGKYVRGVQGYRNGYNSALKVAGKYQAAGKVVGVLGIGVSVIDMGVNGINTSNSLDLAFGIIAFIPGRECYFWNIFFN